MRPVASRPRDRIVLRVEDLPLVGGRPCLDFVNTTGSRGRQPRERLRGLGDFVVWSRRAGLITSREQARIVDRARRHPGMAARHLRAAIDLREALYRTLLASCSRLTPAGRDIARVQSALRRGLAGRRLVWARGQLRWGGFPTADSVEALLGELADDAVRLLTSPDLADVGRCQACDWLYVDRTRNRSRRFCKALCADRVRSRRYYERHKRATRRRTGGPTSA